VEAIVSKSFTRWTRHYTGGLLGGFGLGFMTGTWLSWPWFVAVILGSGICLIGGCLELSAEKKMEKEAALESAEQT
jgi:hypothetical protein